MVAIAQILSTALLRARAAGWSGDSSLAAIETDHVHNLPSIIEALVDRETRKAEDLLTFYLETERSSYERALKNHAVTIGKPLNTTALASLNATAPAAV